MDDDTDGRWLTYSELATLRRIDKPSALKLAIRHRWPRRKNNRGQVTVCVPTEWLTVRDNGMVGGVDGSMDRSMDISRITNAFEDAVTALREQLSIANTRADQAEARAIQAEAARREVEVDADQWWRQGRWARVRKAWRGR